MKEFSLVWFRLGLIERELLLFSETECLKNIIKRYKKIFSKTVKS